MTMPELTMFGSRRKTASKAAADARSASDEPDELNYKPIDLKMIRRLGVWLKPYRKQYVLGVSMGVVMIFMQMTGPWFISRLVDYSTAFLAGSLHGVTRNGAIGHAGLLVAVWAALSIASLLIERARILIMTRAGERVQFDLRRAIFAHLQKLSMSYYDRTKLGRIISRATSDVASLREVNVWGIDAALLNGLMIVVAAVAMATTMSFRLFLSVAWLGPVLYVANRWFLRRSGAGVADRPRRVHTREHEPGREHYRRARGDRLQPPGPEPRRVQPPAGGEHREQHRHQPA